MNNFTSLIQFYLEKFELEKERGLKGWFDRNKGKGWIDCKTGKTCGRQEGEKRRGYPACRPTKAMCSYSKRKKKNSKRIKWISKKD